MPIEPKATPDTAALFEGFSTERVAVGDAVIHCRVGGSGPPLLLLHGCPQTHLMWHKLAPTLARHFTVVASDLRGYGDSSKPRGLPDHENYSFRAMAADQVGLMAKLGFGSFSAAGHDRGARVLHRMALDHADSLGRLVFLDILPTSVLYGRTDRQFASAYWEWFFFIQDHDFPETLLAAAPEAFLRYEIGPLVDDGTIPAAVWDGYLRALSGDGAMHGMCEDYRAGATIDLAHDAADAHRRIASPLLVLWGERNPVWQRFDMLGTWRQFADHVSGGAIDAGHYLAEEAAGQVLERILPFLR
jgi:haloacetate dehalogenase